MGNAIPGPARRSCARRATCALALRRRWKALRGKKKPSLRGLSEWGCWNKVMGSGLSGLVFPRAQVLGDLVLNEVGQIPISGLHPNGYGASIGIQGLQGHGDLLTGRAQRDELPAEIVVSFGVDLELQGLKTALDDGNQIGRGMGVDPFDRIEPRTQIPV